MKTKLFTIAVLFGIVLLLGACGGSKDDPNVSSTTGWEYNNPDNGGFEVQIAVEQETGPGLVFVEGGSFVMGRVEQDLTYDWNNVPRKVTVNSFYMDETEVKNVDYREYLHWLSRVYVDYPEVHKQALPDTLVWRSPMGFLEDYVLYYFRHPSYNQYPVVGVSWRQANNFCAWRTDRVNERILIDQGILEMDPNQLNEENFNTDAYLAGQYEGVVKENLPSLDPNQEERRVKLEDGILLPKYRLPTEAEWEYAAYGLIGNSNEELVQQRKLRPWNGHNMRNGDPQSRGQMMANYKRGKGDMMGVAGYLNDNASVTAPVKAYWPNDYGLFCMAGNVNEWVADVYRPMTMDDFDDFSPFRGNVFQTVVRDEEGNVAEKDSLGRLKYRDITEEEAFVNGSPRMNYSKAYYKNYKDGDLNSSTKFKDVGTDEALALNSQRMYQSEGSGMSSLVSDLSRVYKGGSWKDRAYWLTPATRRYLDERLSTDDLGFRCAMSRVGSPQGF